MKRTIEQGMFVRESGPAGSTPVVWIHGLGESGLCFDGILDHPELRYRRHLVPDLPGYGRTPPSETSWSFTGVADHLIRWLAARGEPPVDLVGHSLGGVLALFVAEQAPERVRRVVDVEGNKSEGDCVYSGRALRWTPEDFTRGGFDVLREEIATAAGGDPATQGYLRSLAMADAGTFRAHAEELVRLSRTEALARRLAGLGSPVHYIAGAPGGACPRSLVLLEAAGLAPTRISPSGHWPFIDQRDRFGEVLRAILGP